MKNKMKTLTKVAVVVLLIVTTFSAKATSLSRTCDEGNFEI